MIVSRVYEILFDVLTREGGTVQLSEICGLNPSIRKAIEDNRLVDLVRNSEHFNLCRSEKGDIYIHLIKKHCPIDDVPAKTLTSIGNESVCRYCNRSFPSRNLMFKHIRKGLDGGLSCREKAISEGMKAGKVEPSMRIDVLLRNSVIHYLDKQDSKRLPLHWLVTKKKVKFNLRKYIHQSSFEVISIEDRCPAYSPEWWVLASNVLYSYCIQAMNSEVFRVHGITADHKDVKSCVSLSNEQVKKISVELVSDYVVSDFDNVGQEQERPKYVQKNLETNSHKSLLFTSNYHLMGFVDDNSIVALSKGCGTRTENVIMQLRNDKIIKSLQNQSRSIEKDKETYNIDSVSRLDQLTSGVMVVPLTLAAEKCLTTQFKEKTVDKIYIALVSGKLDRYGTIDRKLLHVNSIQTTFVSHKGKFAKTEYICLQHFVYGDNYFSLAAVKPISGRTHQIRAHMAHIGHPLVGDRKYNSTQAAKLKWCNRMFLHSFFVRAKDISGESFEFVDPLPETLSDILSLLNHGEMVDVNSLVSSIRRDLKLHLDEGVEENVVAK